jgi:hypothetical protein
MHGKEWTEGEINILREHYPQASKEELMNLLRGRTWTSIASKARKLRVKRLKRENNARTWTEEEIQILLSSFQTAPREELTKRLRRKWSEIVWYANDKLGLKRGQLTTRFWKTKIPELDERAWSYLAGIVDGEGSISLAKFKRAPYFYPRLSIINSNEELMKFVMEKLGVSTGYLHKGTISKGYSIFIYIQGVKCFKLIEKLKSYLVAKRRQAELVLELLRIAKNHYPYDEYYLKEGERIYNEMRKINKLRTLQKPSIFERVPGTSASVRITEKGKETLREQQ